MVMQPPFHGENWTILMGMVQRITGFGMDKQIQQSGNA
jgi:hypothetical protein